MKYLFFDTECSNFFHRKGKICEFGYVLTDENFNIISKNDIPMSPGKENNCRFNLEDKEGNKVIELAYSYDYYFSCPEFPEFYEQIKELMEDEDTICFAYSKDSDIMSIDNTCFRYHLETINYTCYDAQKIVDCYLKSKYKTNQKKAYLLIVGEEEIESITEHLACDDAYMEMKVIEKISKNTNISPIDLAKLCDKDISNSVEYSKAVIKKINNSQTMVNKHRILYIVKNKDIEQLDYDKKIKFDITNDALLNTPNLYDLLNEIHSIGGALSDSIFNTNVMICKDQNDIKLLRKKLSVEAKMTFITLDNFKKYAQNKKKNIKTIKR